MNEAAGAFDKQKTDAAMKFAFDALNQVPKNDAEAFEAHVTAILVLFMGAMWGTLGTEFARGFIQAQLAGMEGGDPECWTAPKVQ